MAKPQKRVLILHTGGTIAMGIPEPPHTDMPLTPDHHFVKSLKKSVPELWRLANIDIRTLMNKDSSQLSPRDWIRLAETIATYYDDYDAFVVTHGTDTMAYTGSALSFLLPHPCKPVVLTGSQKPLGEIRTDARRNLINSVAMAASQWICEVCIFFDTVLLRANRARKAHIEEFHAFDSPNFPWLAQERLKTQYSRPPRERLRKPLIGPSFDSNIAVVRAFPGSPVPKVPQSRAVVIEAFGCGNLPVDMTDFVRECTRQKIPVVLTSQVSAGTLSPEIYDAGRRALSYGAISSRDMTFEATLVKAMMLAGNDVRASDWSAGIQSNWAGEITPIS